MTPCLQLTGFAAQVPHETYLPVRLLQPEPTSIASIPRRGQGEEKLNAWPKKEEVL